MSLTYNRKSNNCPGMGRRFTVVLYNDAGIKKETMFLNREMFLNRVINFHHHFLLVKRYRNFFLSIYDLCFSLTIK